MKKSVKQLCSFFLAATMVITLVAQPKEAEAKKKYSLSEKKIILQVGAAKKITLKGVKKSYKLSWKSNKKSVATVSQKGKVKAKKVGKAKIIVTIKNKKNKKLAKMTCVVIVQKKEQVTMAPTVVPTQNPQPTATQTAQTSSSPIPTAVATETPAPTESVSPAVISGNVAKFPCQVRDAKNPEKIIQIEGVAAWVYDTDTENGAGKVQICASSLEETEEVETAFVNMHWIDREGNIAKDYEFEVVLDGNPDSNLFEIDASGIHGAYSLLFPDVVEGTEGENYVSLMSYAESLSSVSGGLLPTIDYIEEIFYWYNQDTQEISIGAAILDSSETYYNTEDCDLSLFLYDKDFTELYEWFGNTKNTKEKNDFKLYKTPAGTIYYGICLKLKQEDLAIESAEVSYLLLGGDAGVCSLDSFFWFIEDSQSEYCFRSPK